MQKESVFVRFSGMDGGEREGAREGGREGGREGEV